MKAQHYFCFCFNKLNQKIIQSHSYCPEIQYTRYKVELFQDNLFIGKTDYFSSGTALNEGKSLKKSMICFSLSQRQEDRNSFGEIRLIKRSYNCGEELISCYNFSFENHIVAYQKHAKNSLSMTVELTDVYSLMFDILLERTEQAFQNLKRQHICANILANISDAHSQTPSFILKQTSTRPRRESSRAVKLDNEKMIIKTRYWSPDKLSINNAQDDLAAIQRSVIQRLVTSSSNSLKMMNSQKLSLKKTCSQCSSDSDRQIYQQKQQCFFGSLDQISDSQHSLASDKDILQIIRSDSHILLPKGLNEYWVYKQMKSSQITKNPVVQNEPTSNISRSRQKAAFLINVILLFVIAIILGISIELILFPPHNIRKY